MVARLDYARLAFHGSDHKVLLPGRKAVILRDPTGSLIRIDDRNRLQNLIDVKIPSARCVRKRYVRLIWPIHLLGAITNDRRPKDRADFKFEQTMRVH